MAKQRSRATALTKTFKLPTRPTSKARRSRGRAASRQLMLLIEPATIFHFWFESSAGDWRTFRMERGALERRFGGDAQAVSFFRAGAYPKNGGTWGGFYLGPDPLDMRAEHHLLLEDTNSGDSLVLESWGSYAGLKVKFRLYEEANSTVTLLLEGEVNDDKTHSYPLP